MRFFFAIAHATGSWLTPCVAIATCPNPRDFKSKDGDKIVGGRAVHIDDWSGQVTGRHFLSCWIGKAAPDDSAADRSGLMLPLSDWRGELGRLRAEERLWHLHTCL